MEIKLTDIRNKLEFSEMTDQLLEGTERSSVFLAARLLKGSLNEKKMHLAMIPRCL